MATLPQELSQHLREALTACSHLGAAINGNDLTHLSVTRAKHNAGAPSVLVAYGEAASQRLKGCGIKGRYLRLNAEGRRA